MRGRVWDGKIRVFNLAGYHGTQESQAMRARTLLPNKLVGGVKNLFPYIIRIGTI